MFKEIFLGEKKILTLNGILLHVALILTSFVFVYLFSYSTSFRYDLLGDDSAVFQAIGKCWAQGYLPYVDLFDHKGPLIHFINMLGYMIYPRSGIMIPQIICLYLSSLFVWRAMELYSSSKWKVFFLFLTLIYYATNNEEGNHVEEYSVLFLSAAAYCFLRSLKEDKFPPLYAFVYGGGFGACFLTRVSDATQICCQCFLIVVFLLQSRKFKTLWQNILNFLAGAVVIVLPFVIYFAMHDALHDMLYGTILFNLKYTGELFHMSFIVQALYDVFHFLPLFIMIIVVALALKQNSKSRLLHSAIFIGLIMLFMLINLRPYLHYAMIIFPAMPILFAVLCENRDELKKILQAPGLSLKRVLVKILILITAINVCMSISFLKALCLNEATAFFIIAPNVNGKISEYLNSDEQQNVLNLQKLIPQNERNSFVCWGDVSSTSHWLLRTGMKPRERLFMNNSHLTKIDPMLRMEWFSNVRKDYPLWILYGTDPARKPGDSPKTQTEDLELEQLLAEKYLFKGEVYIFPQMVKLYRLKE